jgi:hypothetical protein
LLKALSGLTNIDNETSIEDNSNSRVVLRCVTVMGVPIPNAWLGGLKNIDLISEFGDEQGFWKGFAEGVDNIHVEDGEVKIKLKE